MTAITEDYVSFETAKLLKEKGFNEICYLGYNKNGEYVPTSNRTNSQIIQPDFCFICCPTLQMAMKWLREVYNIHIELDWDKGNQLYSFQIWKSGKYQPEISSLDLWRSYMDDNYFGEWHYEEACEEAIKYCLENII